MSIIATKLVKDGNSTAVRLPKALLKMSGLHGTVGLTAKKGRIIVSQFKQPRTDWKLKIDKIVASKNQNKDSELDAWDNSLLDGIDD